MPKSSSLDYPRDSRYSDTFIQLWMILDIDIGIVSIEMRTNDKGMSDIECCYSSSFVRSVCERVSMVCIQHSISEFKRLMVWNSIK